MAKRRIRRTSPAQNDIRSTADCMTDAARDLSVNAVRVGTDTAKTALQGMREIGRTMASMAAPAARQAVKTANEVTRAAMDSASQMARSTANTTRQATRSAPRPTTRPRKGGKGRTA